MIDFGKIINPDDIDKSKSYIYNDFTFARVPEPVDGHG